MATRTPLFDAEESTATAGTPLQQPHGDEPLTTAPEADVIAGRALMMGALLERSRLESSRDAARCDALTKWVEQHGLFGNLGEAGAELFDAELGSWTDEDVDTVGWAAFELEVLLWALKLVPLSTLETRPEPNDLVQKLPVLGDAETFLDAAQSRDVEELEVQLGLYDALLEAIRSEVYARSILEDPKALEMDDELETLLSTVEARGFNRTQAAAGGQATEAVQGLRVWGRTLLSELFADGSPHVAQKIDSAKLVSLDDATLATWLGMATARTDALAWLVEGEEEAGPDVDG
jgi:hypothetical protein